MTVIHNTVTCVWLPSCEKKKALHTQGIKLKDANKQICLGMGKLVY